MTKWRPMDLGGVAVCSVLVLVCLQASASVEGSFQRTLNANAIVNLEVANASGTIEVRAGVSNQVQITGRIRASEWFGDNAEDKIKRIEANPPIQQSGNDIRIGRIEDPELRHNISISYEVMVPANTRLEAHNGSGSIYVEGLRESVELETGSGEIQLSDVAGAVRVSSGSGGIRIDHVEGNVRAHTGSGSIRATGVAGGFEGTTGSGSVSLGQIASGAVRAETGSGSLELLGMRGSLEAKTGSGSVHVNGNPTGAWSVRTGSGGVRVQIPGDAAFDLDARTGSGSVSLRHPVTVQGTIERKVVQGKVRGGGVSIYLETGSGSIEIE